MKYLLVTNGYPSKKGLYNNAFIHARVKEYCKNGLDVKIFICNNKTKKIDNYIYEGINVYIGGYDELAKHLKNNNYEKIFIHFILKKTVLTVLKNTQKTPIIIWIHGFDIVGWYRRYYELTPKRVLYFFRYIILNIRQRLFIHKIVKNKNRDITYIFMSNWLKKVGEHDTLSYNKFNKSYIIPNIINEKIFKYEEKTPAQRLNILSIRPYASRTYANDIMANAIVELSKKTYFKELTFNIYGDGKYYKKITQPLKKFKNVKLHQTFLHPEEIAKIHKKNGVILIPTRMDSHGVSLGEAMSSGLVPVTSNVAAIPEFVTEKCGYLTNSVKEIVQAIDDIYYNPIKFQKMSEAAAKFVRTKCSTQRVITQEIKVIKSR